jgi:phytoene dehydrogenase-like protein
MELESHSIHSTNRRAEIAMQWCERRGGDNLHALVDAHVLHPADPSMQPPGLAPMLLARRDAPDDTREA